MLPFIAIRSSKNLRARDRQQHTLHTYIHKAGPAQDETRGLTQALDSAPYVPARKTEDCKRARYNATCHVCVPTKATDAD